MPVAVKRRLSGASVIAVISVLVTACGSSGSSSATSSSASSGAATASNTSSTKASTESSSLRIAYDPNPTNTSVVVAEQQGFFTKNGLDVKLTASAATAALLPSVGKQFDLIGGGPSGVLQYAAHGGHPVLVGSETIENGSSRRNTYLLGASGVTSVSQLKGQTVGVNVLSGTQYYALEYELKKLGIGQGEVRFLQVPFADMANDLKSGTIKAALAINPYAAEMLTAGNKDLGDPIANAVDGHTALSIGWVANGSWVKTHAKVIQEFAKAQNEALAWMKSNTKAAQQILVKQFQLPAAAAASYPLTKYTSFAVHPSYLSDWVAPMKAVGALPSSFDPTIGQLIYHP